MTSDYREELRLVSEEALLYFRKAEAMAKEEYRSKFGSHYCPPNHYWGQISNELKETAREVISKILPVCGKIAEAVKSSPLAGSENAQDIKFATKRIRASIGLRKFNFTNLEVVHDEGTVLGVNPPRQDEDNGLSPSDAETEFLDAISVVRHVLKLIEATPRNTNPSNHFNPEASKYRSGTAFIMMWMDPKNPELTDVMDCVKDVFRNFDIRALRADDIEHEGQITERVLNEIRTSEFLFADLTGMRPNVYYETGYAHALGKRVILFRKAGTNLHFDLAGYNCPEYEGLRDLKEELAKRLVSITNKQPKNAE